MLCTNNYTSLKFLIIAIKEVKQDIMRQNTSVGSGMGTYFKAGAQGKLLRRGLLSSEVMDKNHSS